MLSVAVQKLVDIRMASGCSTSGILVVVRMAAPLAARVSEFRSLALVHHASMGVDRWGTGVGDCRVSSVASME